MGAWSKDSKSHVSTMSDGDFRSTERSVTMAHDDELRIEYVAGDGAATVLKASIPVLAGRDRRRRGDARARARRVPAGADRRRQGAGRPLLPAPEGDDDEGLGPDHLRPRRAGVLRRRVHRVPRRARAGASPNNGLASDPDRDRRLAASARRSRRRSRRPTRPGRTSRWSTPTAGSRTCTSRAT